MSRDDNVGQLHTLGLLEQQRHECKDRWGGSSAAYFRVDGLLRELANPNLHDIPRTCPSASSCGIKATSIRWVVSASSSVALAHAALDAAIANYPDQRFTLRNGILVIRKHPKQQRI